jgi:ATP-dependent Lhr-like helicase
MLITTPETFQILFVGFRLRQYLQTVQWVIIDEIHELAHDERGAQLAVALERLEEITQSTGHGFQRIGLSATVGASTEVSRYLGGLENQSFRKVNIVEIDSIKHTQIHVELPHISKSDREMSIKLTMEPMSFASLRRCEHYISSHVSTLLFINTRDGAEILASRFHLWKPDFPVGVHHGSLSKHARIEAEDQFKDGTLKSLICTSSLELGIDVGDTDFIIQYNSPREVTRIVQRIGRSGHRIGKVSCGVIISTTPEDLAESIVIGRRLLQGELEVFSVRQNPLSVLSNQIISIALASGRIHRDQLYSLLTRSYPFHQLKQKQYYSIIEQLSNQRSIWVEDEFIGKRRNSRKYFLDNISMIPDEKTYNAVDISSRRKIGTLDERFVLNHGFEGAKFILHGRPWNIIKREEEQILIAQSKELGEVPSWAGEDIPVPYEIAQEVGSIRRRIANNEPISEYPCKKDMITPLSDEITKQKQEGFIVPDDKTITLEVQQKLMIINLCAGTKVNETLGRIISALLAQSIGESIGITSDAYRIHLELPSNIKAERIKTILESINPESLWYLLHTILRNSTYIRWQLVHSARKFGALRKDFDYKNIGIKRLFNLFENTLIMDEAIDKLIWERMDISDTQRVLRSIQDGTINIVIQGVSPIGVAGGETMRGLMVPIRADRSILMALNKRLEETHITFACVNCHNTWNTTVSRAPDHPKCRRCGAIKIAVIPSYRTSEISIFKKQKLTPQEKHEYKRLSKNASLILSYGKNAILCLMGRGIGPDTAARILRKYDSLELKKSEDDKLKFLRDIHKAEVHYARTKGFWDS